VRVAVTGTPGTGKTTATEQLENDIEVVHLNEVIRDRGLTRGRDETRDTLVADIDAVEEWLADRDDILLESHLAHRFAADRVVVLRCHPEVVETRLAERGEPEETIAENAESEALDVILSEAVAEHGEESVYEIDTTDRSPGDVAAVIGAVVAGDRDPAVGTVSFLDYL
jgi:adenylate kinase